MATTSKGRKTAKSADKTRSSAKKRASTAKSTSGSRSGGKSQRKSATRKKPAAKATTTRRISDKSAARTKKAGTKKAPSKKTTVKKASAKKAPAKKAPAKKAPAEKAPAKKTTATKAPAKKAPAKKASAKKAPAKKAPAKKASAKKAPAKKAPAKKAPAKKATAKRPGSKRTTGKRTGGARSRRTSRSRAVEEARLAASPVPPTAGPYRPKPKPIPSPATVMHGQRRFAPEFPRDDYDFTYLIDFLEFPNLPERCRAAVLGCGRGEASVYLSERGYRVTGLDEDRTAIGLARERAWLNDRDVDFMIGDVFETAGLLPAESYGIAIDKTVFHRIEGERTRRRYLESVARLLLPGGIFLLTATFVRLPKRARKSRSTQRQATLMVQEGGEVVGEVIRSGLNIVGRHLYPATDGSDQAELILYCRK